MATKRLQRPRDPIALAKLIGDFVTGQTVDAVEAVEGAFGAAVDYAQLVKIYGQGRQGQKRVVGQFEIWPPQAPFKRGRGHAIFGPWESKPSQRGQPIAWFSKTIVTALR